ncbi:DUF3347 domain-containing protein [Algoriphagus sp. D3-2-R+10]|uniref:DUF3347 domain-containing protein n=1 Tax=Algoriphagus aurantiacus TaxID=3103948 RepID=UPI002B397FF3|nr:DUF3347 domain-containing protein [Algoriphagus sp. D3-2-R+10]MEB2775848.1 DUF3347 domain-containing protein [Algoriphagus sp. D3-2-R+10]
MKNSKTPLTFILLIALSLACTSKSTENQSLTEDSNTHEMHEAESNQPTTAATATIAFKEESITQIFNAYLAVKDALVESNGEKVSREAEKLKTLLTEEKYKSIKVDVQKIAESKDPEIQRETFNSLSDQMIELAKNSELATGNLFLQHCPMANGNKGANWISLSEEIKNPYFGEKMLKCGSVTEKI